MTQLPILAKNHCAMCGYLLDDDLNCPECEVCHPKDEVNHPSHYTTGGIECIDAMKSMMEGADVPSFISYDWGAAFKYIWRWHYKGKPIQDLEKAKWYIDKMIETLKDRDEVHDKNKTD